MLTWIGIAAGVALGCVACYGVNRLVHQHWPLMRFPAATPMSIWLDAASLECWPA